MDLRDPNVARFLTALSSHQRETFVAVFRAWREGGGLLRLVGASMALQTEWEDQHLTILWAYGPAPSGVSPRFEAPLAALARRGVPAEAIEEWRDDLTTVSGVGPTPDGANVTIPVDEAFDPHDARKLADSALRLARII